MILRARDLGRIVVLVGVRIDTQRARTWGRIMVLMVVWIDTQRGCDLGLDHGYGGDGDRYSESRVPGRGSQFCWGWYRHSESRDLGKDHGPGGGGINPQ